MKPLLSLVALCYVVVANPTPSLPLHPGGIGGLYKGPSAETIIKGPDGSVITAAASGGEVEAKLGPIVVAEPAVVKTVTPLAIAVTPSPVVVGTVEINAPIIEPVQSSDIVGPSGAVSTRGSQSVIAGPASTTITGPAVLAETVVRGPPIIASPVPVVAPVAAVATPIATVTGPPVIAVTGAPSLVAAAGGSATVAAAGGTVAATATGGPVVATVGGPVVAVTGGSTVATAGVPVATVTGTPSGTLVSASTSPHHSAATASSSSSAVATASAGPNLATASIDSSAKTGILAVQPASSIGLIAPSVSTIAPLPIISSTIAPIIDNGIRGVEAGIAGIGSRIGIDGVQVQLAQGKLGIDGRPIGINPSLLPTANIISAENAISAVTGSPIAVAPALVSSTLAPAIGGGAIALSAEQQIALHQQKILLNNDIQNAKALGVVGVAPSNEIVVVQKGAAGLLAVPTVVNVTPRNGITAEVSTSEKLVSKSAVALSAVQEQAILSTQLAKAGIDASQIQLANVPLSAVSPLHSAIDLTNPIALKAAVPGLWARPGRDAEKKKE